MTFRACNGKMTGVPIYNYRYRKEVKKALHRNNKLLPAYENPGDSLRRKQIMAINFVDGKYVDEKGFVKLDPTIYKDWQIAYP